MVSSSNPDEFNQKLNQLIRQSRLGLLKPTVERPLHHWLSQLEELLPGLVKPCPNDMPIQFEQIIRSPLTMPDRTTLYLEVPVSYYGHEKFITVCTWGFRSPRATWIDRLKVWSVYQHRPPSAHVALEIIILHPTDDATIMTYPWYTMNQTEMTLWLQQFLSGHPTKLRTLLTLEQFNAHLDQIEAKVEVLEAKKALGRKPKVAQ